MVSDWGVGRVGREVQTKGGVTSGCGVNISIRGTWLVFGSGGALGVCVARVSQL